MERKRSCFKQSSAQESTNKERQISGISFMDQVKKRVKRNTSKDRKHFMNPYQEIPFLPQYQLTKQEMMKDPLQLVLKLQHLYEIYGAVKLKSAKQWQPPFCFKYTDKENPQAQKRKSKIFLHDGFHHAFIFYLQQFQAFEEIQGAYNVKAFQEYAQKFQKQYKFKFQREGSTPQSQLQNEYWKLIKGAPLNSSNSGKYKVTVQYAADLPVTKHGSGFPIFQNKSSKDDNFDYKQNFFNLNNLYKTPTSILRISDERKQYISGITVPWVYMGMMFSSFCWHVEDLWLNSINYNHKGGIKTWYVIPASDKLKFDKFVQKVTGRPQFLDRITFMIDPLEIKKAGIKIYKTYQRPGDYVCTFFKAYHAGFSQGFNVGQAVNFISGQSLNIIKEAQKCYQTNNQRKASVISYQWLVHENCRKQSIPSVRKEFQQILQSEYNYLKEVITKFKIKQIVQIGDEFKYDKNSCSQCRKYLYLSSIKCLNCQKNYCQKHLHDCCSKGFSLLIRKPFGKRKKNIQTIQNLL